MNKKYAFAFGIIIYVFYPSLIMLFITRFFGIKIAGEFTFLYYLVTTFSTIGNYGGRTYQVSDCSDRYSDSDYFSLRFVSSLLMFLLVFIFSLLNRYNIQRMELLLYLTVYKIIEAIEDSIFGIFQKQNKIEILGYSYILKSVLSVGLFISISVSFHNFRLSVFSLIASNLVIFFFYVLRNSKERLFFNIRIQTIDLLNKNFSIFVFTFLQVILVNLPRYFVDEFLSKEESGIFGILFLLTSVVSLFAQLYIQPALRQLSTLRNGKEYVKIKKTISSIFFTIIAIGCLSIVLLNFIGTFSLSLLFGINLEGYRLELLIAAFGGMVLGITNILVLILVVLQKSKIQSVFYLIIIALSSILSFILVPKFGIMGAMITFTITATLLSVIFFTYYSKLIRTYISMSE
jgi:O-antigen/teichoic acid export membrane protein